MATAVRKKYVGTKYPLGGIGLDKEQNEKLATKLIAMGVSLKWIQRKLFTMWLNGEIEVKID